MVTTHTKRIQYSRYGGPELMRVEDFQLAAPGKGEVAVQVKFAAINPIDWKLRNGQMKIVTGEAFPRAMGMDFSGTVIGVGAGVTRHKAGDAVFGLARFKESGALGEAVVTKDDFLATKPENISFEAAACLGTPGVTAWNGLIDKAKLRTGQHVFINGCAGAVGEAAVQIAQLFGAVVSGSCSARDMERATSLGVQHIYDYRTSDLSKITTRFDVVYDTATTMTVSDGLAMLCPAAACSWILTQARPSLFGRFSIDGSSPSSVRRGRSFWKSWRAPLGKTDSKFPLEKSFP